MQYTIRGIPPTVDTALRARARAAGKSLNEAAVAALAESAGVTGTAHKRRDLGDIAGTWKTDKAVESALAAQHRMVVALRGRAIVCCCQPRSAARSTPRG